MKKILICALVLGLAVMFALPAFAFKIESAKDTTFYFGGLIYTDLAAWNRSKELFQPTTQKSDNTQMILNVPNNSRVRGALESGNVGAYWEIRLGGDQQYAQGASGNYSSTGGYYLAESGKLYGYYKFGNCTLLAGKTDGHVYSVLPYQNLGNDENRHSGGSGWGAVVDQRVTQVRFSQDVSKSFGYDISLVQPMYYNDNGQGSATGAPQTTNAAGVNNGVQSYATFPLLAAKLRMNFGAVSLMPAGYVEYVKWDNLPRALNNTTPDDNMTSWAVVLPVVVKAGAFTGTIQGAYGQNMGSRFNNAQGVLDKQSIYHGYGRTPNGALKSTTGYNAFMDLAFASGPVTPHFYVGYDKAQNDDVYVGDKYNQRWMYGVGVNWKIADSFYIIPEFTYYNWGNNPTAAKNPSLGTEWLGGVEFQFVF